MVTDTSSRAAEGMVWNLKLYTHAKALTPPSARGLGVARFLRRLCASLAFTLRLPIS